MTRMMQIMFMIFFTNRLSSTSGVKHYIFNDILVTSNSNDAIDILGY